MVPEILHVLPSDVDAAGLRNTLWVARNEGIRDYYADYWLLLGVT